MASFPARLALPLTTSALVAGLLMAPTASTAGAATASTGGTGGIARTATAATAATSDDNTLDILVLGDSYSAGNGATDDQGAEQTYGPDMCRRSRVNWSEKYAAALRAGGQAVRLVNHACSGGVTADITSPRKMDTKSAGEPTPAGVTTNAQADASLAKEDPCNTQKFPDEEFWTYKATLVTPLVVTYDCTRNLRPQADFVNADVDLVLFTMGGNDAGFSSIVQNCFVPLTRNSAGCKEKVDTARALLPQIKERLLADIAAIRAHGLRNDAKMVQLGYPWLQTDNNFTLPDPPGYAAGKEVRALVSDGDAAIAAAVPDANVGHPGQMAFLAGVPEKFSGHEPDASTPAGNPDRWINQVGDGMAVEVFYHPNRFGHQAYAELLLAQGTFGAPTVAPTAPTVARPKARLGVKVRPSEVQAGRKVRIRVSVKLSDGSRPRGKVVVRGLPHHQKLLATRLHASDKGILRLRVRLRDASTNRLRVIYRDKVAAVVRETRRVNVHR